MNLYIKLSVCVPRLIPGRGFYAQISSEITSEFLGVTVALCHLGGYRVVFNNVDVVSRLLSITIWAYMLRDSRGGPLMVTAQYGYSSRLVYIHKTNS